MSPQRTLWSDLRSIDQAIVPRLAALVERVRSATRDLRPTVAGGGGPFTVARRLDQRYARRGALALIRDVPQVGAAMLTVLLVVAAVLVAARSGSNDSPGASGSVDLPAVNGLSGLTVGPVSGDTRPVAEYLADARNRLAAVAQETPHERIFAIADLEKAATPEQAARAVPQVEVLEVFLQVSAGGATQYFPSPGAEFVAKALKDPLRVDGLPAEAGPVFEAVAAGLLQQASDNEEFVKSIDGLPTPTDADREQRAAQSADARRYRAAAGALRTRCACIYAMVIRAEAQTLANIANSGTVRVIDPALSGIPYQRLRWVPLPTTIKDTATYKPPPG
jgi:hypothetical protein